MTQELSYSVNLTYTLAAEASAKPISMEGFRYGSVQTTATASIAVYGSNQATPEDNTFVVAETGGSAVTVASTNAKAAALPAACFAYRYIKLVDAGGGTVYVHLKS